MSFRFHSDVLQCFSMFLPAHLAEVQPADGEDSWSSSALSRENNCVMCWQDQQAQLGKHGQIPQQWTVVKLTIWGRCWHFLTCLCRTSCILSYSMEDRALLSTLYCDLTAVLRTDAVSCAINGASSSSLTWKGCVCQVLSIFFHSFNVTPLSSSNKCCFAIVKVICKLLFGNSCHHCHWGERGLLLS